MVKEWETRKDCHRQRCRPLSTGRTWTTLQMQEDHSEACLERYRKLVPTTWKSVNGRQSFFLMLPGAALSNILQFVKFI